LSFNAADGWCATYSKCNIPPSNPHGVLQEMKSWVTYQKVLAAHGKTKDASPLKCAVVKDAGKAAKGVVDLTPGFAVGDCRDGPYPTGSGHGGSCNKGRTGLAKDLPDLSRVGCIKACTDMKAAAIQLGHQDNSRRTNIPNGKDRLSNCFCFFASRAKPSCPAGWVAYSGYPKGGKNMKAYTAYNPGSTTVSGDKK
jgi:hypothetical protein